MNNGVEIDFVVSDSLVALKQYEQIFEIQRIEVTNLSKGQNEVIFEMNGTRFHLFDENPEYHLIAPKKDAACDYVVECNCPRYKKNI